MNYFRMTMAKDGGYVIETDARTETLIDSGRAVHFIHVPSLNKFPTPLLEDIFHDVNAELSLRDRNSIEGMAPKDFA